MAKSRTFTRWLQIAGLCVLVALIAPSASGADSDFGIVPGSLEIHTLDSEGNPDTQAGSHPARLLVKYQLHSEESSPRQLIFEFGPGLVGAPFAIPVCPRAVFEDEECPLDTQVGVFKLAGVGTETLSNIAPASNEIAALGFAPLWQSELGMFLRSTDFGLSMDSGDLVQTPSPEGEVELWGVPDDHLAFPEPERIAFLTTPTECGPLSVVLRARSWEGGSQWVSETGESAPFTDCESLPFEPHFGMQLSDTTPDSPTGTQIDLGMTAHTEPDERVSADLKDVTVHFPPGVSVSPGSVEGMEVCRDSQFGLGTSSTVTCPPLSRVGTVEITTPQLAETLTGQIFLGEEKPNERFRLFIDASALGIHFKALGKLVTDPQTGDLSAVLSNLPQVPLSLISLHLDNASAPLLASPLSCGPVSAQAKFVPYGGQEPVVSSANVDIEGEQGSPCTGSLGFSPKLVAGSMLAKAGVNTDFSFTFTRQDGEQLPKKITLLLPEGLNANLSTVDLCSDAAAEAETCPPSSRIGSTFAEVGSGPTPALVRGSVFLTEPYRGAPFGLSMVFDAKIGPFNLGALNVRGMLRVDPHTGQHSLEIDPLPTLFQGLSLRFRTVGVDFDRPGFLVSPTSCQPAQIVAHVYSVDGRSVPIVDPFYVGGCDSLGFRPRFSLSVDGEALGHGKQRLSFGVRTRSGDASVRQFQVKFPKLLVFHSHGVRAICARGDAAEDLCPASSRVGTSTARSPLLDEPLRGPVYLVQPKGGGFPDFSTSVEGGGVPLQLTGESFRQGGHFVTKMVGLPDLPLSEFTMHLNGGKSGLFSLTKSPCGGHRTRELASPVSLLAQNGAHRGMQVQLKASCPSSGR
jgi:hypothetical protein